VCAGYWAPASGAARVNPAGLRGRCAPSRHRLLAMLEVRYGVGAGDANRSAQLLALAGGRCGAAQWEDFCRALDTRAHRYPRSDTQHAARSPRRTTAAAQRSPLRPQALSGTPPRGAAGSERRARSHARGDRAALGARRPVRRRLDLTRRSRAAALLQQRHHAERSDERERPGSARGAVGGRALLG